MRFYTFALHWSCVVHLQLGPHVAARFPLHLSALLMYVMTMLLEVLRLRSN